MLAAGGAGPIAEGTVPVAEDAIPTAEGAVPTTVGAVPVTEDPSPVAGGTVPATRGGAIDQIKSAYKMPTPQSQASEDIHTASPKRAPMPIAIDHTIRARTLVKCL